MTVGSAYRLRSASTAARLVVPALPRAAAVLRPAMSSALPARLRAPLAPKTHLLPMPDAVRSCGVRLRKHPRRDCFGSGSA